MNTQVKCVCIFKNVAHVSRVINPKIGQWHTWQISEIWETYVTSDVITFWSEHRRSIPKTGTWQFWPICCYRRCCICSISPPWYSLLVNHHMSNIWHLLCLHESRFKMFFGCTPAHRTPVRLFAHTMTEPSRALTFGSPKTL